MTAINVVCSKRHSRIYFASDAAAYDSQGVIGGFTNKVVPMPQWPGALAVRGRGIGGPMIAYMLGLNFQTFDDVVDHIETALPSIVEELKIDGHVELILAGFSAERCCPESYVVETSNAAPVGISDAEAAAAEYLPEAYVLRKLPEIINGPPATRDVVEAARFTGFAADDEPSTVIGGLEMVLEMQRHSLYADRIHWVGGWGQLTVITPEGIEQRVLQRWHEDMIGELIQPSPMDWPAWRARRTPTHSAGDAPVIQMSRHERRAAQAKAKKG